MFLYLTPYKILNETVTRKTIKFDLRKRFFFKLIPIFIYVNFCKKFKTFSIRTGRFGSMKFQKQENLKDYLFKKIICRVRK